MGAGGPLPTTVSVIVCAHNEERLIVRCLTSLLTQDYPATEVLVVNNASEDRTGEFAAAVPNVKVVDEPRRGLLFARERGRLEASGELLVFIDADCVAAREWLGRILSQFEGRPMVAAVSGNYRYNDWHWFGQLIIGCYDFSVAPLTHFVVKRVMRRGAILYGGNFAVRRSALANIGGFDLSVEFHGEDTNLGRRLLKAGDVRLSYTAWV